MAAATRRPLAGPLPRTKCPRSFDHAPTHRARHRTLKRPGHRRRRAGTAQPGPHRQRNNRRRPERPPAVTEQAPTTPRKRGAQPGNANALQHGFYSDAFTLDELALVAALTKPPSPDDEV